MGSEHAARRWFARCVAGHAIEFYRRQRPPRLRVAGGVKRVEVIAAHQEPGGSANTFQALLAPVANGLIVDAVQLDDLVYRVDVIAPGLGLIMQPPEGAPLSVLIARCRRRLGHRVHPNVRSCASRSAIDQRVVPPASLRGRGNLPADTQRQIEATETS